MLPETPDATAVTGAVRLWLRLEGLAVFVLALLFYHAGGYSWLLFAILILVPDLSILGYAAGARVGAMTYNALHTYVGPLVLTAVLLLIGRSLAVPLIWVAHIGVDRAVGYGLKRPTDFGHTHLGAIGVRSRGRPRE